MTKRELNHLKDAVHQRLLEAAVVDAATGCHVFRDGKQFMLRVGGVAYEAHRVAAWVYKGGFDLADESVDVRRKCGSNRCVNGEHLTVVGQGELF